MKSFEISKMNPKEIYHLLVSCVSPRPIALASTISNDGISNLSPFSFFNVFSANPPILVFSPAKSSKTNIEKDTLINAKKTKEVVINMVDLSIIEEMSLSSAPFKKEVDEFIKSGLTPIKSDKVAPYRVKESPIQFECKVNDIIALGDKGGAGNLIIAEVLKIHVKEQLVNTNDTIKHKKLNLISRMGGNWYLKSNAQSMFEIEGHQETVVGFDNLPDYFFKLSFSKTQLLKLAKIKKLPSSSELKTYETASSKQDLFEIKKMIEAEQIDEAWLQLLSYYQ